MITGKALIAAAVFAATIAGLPNGPARAADKARITGLSDVAFGVVSTAGDQSASQSLCAYTSSNTNGYSVAANGDGIGGSFALSSGMSQLPYDALWADAPNGTSGTTLIAGSAMSGFTSTASQQSCNSGPSSSASLTIVIRAATLGSARAGTYSGALQITISPE